MIKSITFKCSEGNVFTFRYDAGSGFVYLDRNGKREISVLTGCGFHLHGDKLFPGRYEAIARLIKDYGIYDRGIDNVTIEREHPFILLKFAAK